MSKIRPFAYTASICSIFAGLAVIAAGAFLLRRLDNHMYEHPLDFYDLARHYGSITWAGALVCLAGCLGLALAITYREGFRAGLASAVIGFATAAFGLLVFPIHQASGNVYFTLLGVTFGASVVFLLVASVRYIWYRSHSIR